MKSFFSLLKVFFLVVLFFIIYSWIVYLIVGSTDYDSIVIGVGVLFISLFFFKFLKFFKEVFIVFFIFDLLLSLATHWRNMAGPELFLICTLSCLTAFLLVLVLKTSIYLNRLFLCFLFACVLIFLNFSPNVPSLFSGNCKKYNYYGFPFCFFPFPYCMKYGPKSEEIILRVSDKFLWYDICIFVSFINLLYICLSNKTFFDLIVENVKKVQELEKGE